MNIYDFKRQGKSVREIARATGHPRNTIRKYLRDGVRPGAKRQPQPSMLDPFKPYPDEQLARGVFNCNRLLREIRAQGYSRASYVEYVEHQDLSTLLRCLIHSFEALGRVSQTVVFDNLKAVAVFARWRRWAQNVDSSSTSMVQLPVFPVAA